MTTTKRRNMGWKVIKTLTADETRAARVQLLRSSAAAHAEIGEAGWAAEYARRADEFVAPKGDAK